MSAKQRRVKDPVLDCAVAPGSPQAKKLAAIRVLVLARQLQGNPEGVPLLAAPKPSKQKTRGRPRSTAPAKMLAEYNLDVEHLEVLRQLGFGNVPPNKTALAALVKRLFPNDPNPTATMNAIKQALRRERRTRQHR